ncbi:MAG: FIST N-terminal domain-containing protein [Planctomycetota bacterium]
MSTPAPGRGPRCASAVSRQRNLDAAVGEVLEALEEGLDGATPDLLVAFATHHYGGDLPRLGGELREGTGAAGLIGCTGAWTIGSGEELETSPGVSVLAASLPDTRIAQVRIRPPEDGGAETLDFPLPDPATSSVLVFADPFSFPTTAWLRAYAESDACAAPLVGGLASGGVAPGQNVLWMGSEPYTNSAVALVLEGATRLEPVVSQGCRPIGPPLVVTGIEGTAVTRIGGEPAAKAFMSALEGLAPEERSLFEAGALVGRAVDAARTEERAGELIVRPLLGLDPRTHAVHVADEGLRRGVTLRIMVRDAASASSELDAVLKSARESEAERAFGGLLVTCNGRGRGMFERENADAELFARHFGSGFPLAGFSASGEIGPVGRTPFLHGFTASGALFTTR